MAKTMNVPCPCPGVTFGRAIRAAGPVFLANPGDQANAAGDEVAVPVGASGPR